MKIEQVPITIDMDGGDVEVYDNSITIGPHVLVHVVAKAPHWSETVDGDVQLRRKKMREIKQAVAPIIEQNRHWLDVDTSQSPEAILKAVPEMIQKLTGALNTVMIPGELEIDSIGLIGSWPAYGAEPTALLDQYHQQHALHLAERLSDLNLGE
ncbi:hypothetical protein ACFQ3L_00390 [Lacticaseibacillus jixianensis]|uniref:Uncharacterized protein n=1 Tax=Lacticaseibacillus jixianensis TaxID=2486012 RepID=A0ABW4B9C2_9LACO|nr:hypothetical protein [Lacticaseibacillus jixianensis]